MENTIAKKIENRSHLSNLWTNV